MKLKRKKYARDFSQLDEMDRLAFVAAMVRVGREAAEKERARNLREAGRALSQRGTE